MLCSILVDSKGLQHCQHHWWQTVRAWLEVKDHSHLYPQECFQKSSIHFDSELSKTTLAPRHKHDFSSYPTHPLLRALFPTLYFAPRRTR